MILHSVTRCLRSVESDFRQQWEEIRTAPVLHDTVVAPEDMPAAVRKILGI